MARLHEAELDAITPGYAWWQGRTACTLCGYGTPGHDVREVRSVIPIPEVQSGPFLMECPWCRNMTLKPVEE